MTYNELDEASLLYGANARILQSLHAKYLEDPNSVDTSWSAFFALYPDDLQDVLRENDRASWALDEPSADGVCEGLEITSDSALHVKDAVRVLMLIRAYRVRGHLEADLDPLNLDTRVNHPELDPSTYGFSEEDLDRPIFLDGVLGFKNATLKKILEVLRQTYCHHVAVEFMHCQDPEHKAWIQQHVESPCAEKNVTNEERLDALRQLMYAETFEAFLHTKYTGAKKFGLDGLEAFIPCLQEALRVSIQLGVQEAIMGMAHRGRLNVLKNIMGKPAELIFSEFQGTVLPLTDIATGDVKYHLGYSSDRVIEGHKMHLSLMPNPSHLEAVDPVALGKVRAKQDLINDKARKKVMGVLVHGDAAFIGQGIVPECFCLSELDGYCTGGTLHIVTNNQIGFTTNPIFSRSSPYCSDVAKIVQAPIFHVNAHDMDSILFVSRLAARFRHTFNKDVVIDIIGYRRNGHNEGDDPSFTQPKMYKEIESMLTPMQHYAQKLIQQGIMTEARFQGMKAAHNAALLEDFEAAVKERMMQEDWLEGHWKGLKAASPDENPKSNLSVARLKELGLRLVENAPDDFHMHKRLDRFLSARRTAIETGENIDWATAESLAYATLLVGGISIRHTGQDCQRGTFSQRHAVFTDQISERSFTPLNHLEAGQEKIEIINSPLAEFSVLGFEYGYSLTDPKSLVLWEAQFGDFSNGAQVIFDQFLSSAEDKWLRMSGLVVLLPHGFEGQGPEHSSARPERFLQLCAKNNMQIVNCTTPANYFHVLRRQILRSFRKPLIVFTPKSLLRHKFAVSSLKEMAQGSAFKAVIREDDVHVKSERVARVILSTGKVFYDLLSARNDAQQYDTALARLEQLYPFPHDQLVEILKTYKNAKNMIWCQEEPENMGAWFFINSRLEKVMQDAGFESKRPVYVGRSEAASPATGFAQLHAQEQKALVDKALSLDTIATM